MRDCFASTVDIHKEHPTLKKLLACWKPLRPTIFFVFATLTMVLALVPTIRWEQIWNFWVLLIVFSEYMPYGQQTLLFR